MNPRYFPFDGNPYAPKMGVQALDIAKWIEIDPERWNTELTLRENIVATTPDLVIRALPEATEACLELRDLLASHLAQHFPERYRKHGDLFETRGKTYGPPAGPVDALKQLATWTQEDWAILQGETAPRLVGGAILFPSRWNLPDKLGLDPLGVHKPVPHFNTIAGPTERTLARIRDGYPLWRVNWTIHDSADLHVPFPHESDPDLTEGNILEKTYVRTERQTLRRLPKSNAVVFSIRTYLYKISDLVQDADRHGKLLGTLAGMPRDSANYKGMRDFYDMLVSALRNYR